MAKRTATREINHENWDQDDEPEDPGTFQRASEEELKGRVIKTAKRKSLNSQGVCRDRRLFVTQIIIFNILRVKPERSVHLLVLVKLQRLHHQNSVLRQI